MSQFVCLSFYLSICRSACLSVCQSICLFVNCPNLVYLFYPPDARVGSPPLIFVILIPLFCSSTVILSLLSFASVIPLSLFSPSYLSSLFSSPFLPLICPPFSSPSLPFSSLCRHFLPSASILTFLSLLFFNSHHLSTLF